MSQPRDDKGRLRPMLDADLDQVLVWRNHPETRRYMLSQHEITMDEHKRWFIRVSRDPSRRVMVFEYAGMALGFVSFAGASKGGTADWGFYAAPDAPKGTGRKLGRTALEFGFSTIGLHKICGQALDFNEASIRFHRALGFRQEGVLREQCMINDKYHSLICFGLLKQEWHSMLSD